MNSERGNLFMLVAPSGAGKSTLADALLVQDKAVRLSISYTTRLPRAGEADGREYHFVSPEDFFARAARGEFIEYAQVHGYYYATSKAWIAAQMALGHDVLLEIDWQGAQQIRAQFGDAVSIFILPPSLDVLEARLNKRAQDSADVIARRVQAAGDEIAHAGEFDYIIINKTFSAALVELQTIVSAMRLRFSAQCVRHVDLFRALGLGNTLETKGCVESKI
jgi:guanylate kinase